MSIKVMIVDDQQLMREGLKTILNIEKDIDVVALAENGQEALNELKSARPDVVLMDIRMPVMNGVDCTKAIKEQCPDIKVLVLTTFDDDEYIIEALANGAEGYLLKDLPSEKLISCIRDINCGKSIMQPEIAAKVISHIKSMHNNVRSCRDKENKTVEDELFSIGASYEIDSIGLKELTQREKEILRQMAKGLSNKEISKTLYISEGTVKNYISSIYEKLGVSERSKVILFAIENKLI